MHCVWGRAAYVALLLQQEGHSRGGEGAGDTGLGVHLRGTFSSGVLRKDHIRVPEWGVSVAHLAWPGLVTRQAKDGGHFVGSG